MSRTPAVKRQPAWLLLVVVAAVLFIVGLAATSPMGRMVEVIPRPPKPPPSVAPHSEQGQPLASPSPTQQPTPPNVEPMPPWLQDIIKAAIVMVGLIAVAVFVWRLAQALSQRFGERARAAQSEAQEIPDIEDAELAESLEQSIQELRSGSAVDSAIVDCWRRLESIALDSGVERKPSQTAEEFTVDMLSRTAVSPQDLAELAELYRAAMFSTHTFVDADRDLAIGCLERLAAALNTSQTLSGTAASWEGER